MKRTLTFLPALFFVFFLHAQQHSLTLKWQTDSTLKVPESVYYDAARKVLFVSNIDGAPDGKDGKGSVGKVGLDGKIIQTDWVSGLNAPKGIGIWKNNLYVADLDAVAEIDITKAQITRRIPIDGAVFLNDITVDKKGIVYVSDTRTSKVYRIENGKPALYLENLKGPNGLLAMNNQLYILNSGELLRAGGDKQLQKIAGGMEPATDGIENVKGNEFIVSCWNGIIYYVNENGTTQQLLDTREQKMNTADIGYDPKNRIVYVPTFFKNSVVAYQLK
jgi:hypothetical protein